MTEFRQKNGAESVFTISLASLAGGAGRVSTQLAQNEQFGVRGQVSVVVKMGAVGPTLGTLLQVYLIRGGRSGGTEVDSNLGVVDAAVATLPNNVELIGSIMFDATANKIYKKTFFVENASRFFSILIWNGGGQPLSATGGDHVVAYQPIYDEVV